MGQSATPRREITLEDFNQVIEESHKLSQSGYYKAGTWSLGQICQHLSQFMEQSLDGFKDEPSLLLKLASPVIKMMYLGKMLKGQTLTVKAAALPSTLPDNNADDPNGIVLLEKNIKRILAEDATFRTSPVFGKLTPEKWRKLHLWHCNHHLSFLTPPTAQPVRLREAS
ncbi:MAG: hypothetical protein COA78_27270 [Blastopirellula sp.]|nr:MAG: hypothetical protein COA78_27270 [Blastopirellula sp.]